MPGNLWNASPRERKVRAESIGFGGASASRLELFPLVDGAPEGIRTPNLLIRSQMLYPLSYGRISVFICYAGEPYTNVAEARGFEPPVPCKGDNSLAVSPIRPLWHAS